MAVKEFKAIPGTDELAQVERHLVFHPSTITDPKTLTREQVEAYNRDGYIKGIRVFSAEEMAGYRAFFDEVLAKVLAEGGSSYSISTAHHKYATAYDLLTHPRIVALVKDLLGENVIGWGCHFFCKMPHDGKVVNWHQDASYWPLSEAKTVTVWLAIDDADVENACMRFIPGSQNYGHLTYQMTEETEDAVLNQKVENAEEFGRPVDDELLAGEVSMHSDLLLHSSLPNESNRRRCGLTLRYCAAEVRAGLDWNLKGVIVAGSDPTGHWANSPRPEA